MSLYSDSNVPERHGVFRPFNSTSPEWNTLYDALKLKIEKGIMLALIGNRGTGKTQLGCCLIGYCCYYLKKQGMYCKAADVFASIRAANKSDDDCDYRALARFVKPFLFVVDAFEVRADTSYEQRTLDTIIDKRYDALKSTIIISNDDEESLDTCLRESIMDRMRETGGVITMNGKSFRDKA